MRMVVSAQGESLDAPTSPVFGRCPTYIFVDSESMQFEAVPNPAMNQGGGAGIQADLRTMAAFGVFGTTLVAFFLAEMGDKTQLATLTLAASGSSRWLVFAGSALALVATSAVAAVAGEAVSRAVPAVWLHRIAGVAFLVLGALFLFRSGD